MSNALRKFVEDREAVLANHHDLATDVASAAAWRREIAVYRSLTDKEARDLEEGRQLPSSGRIEELSCALGLTAQHCESLLRGVADILGTGVPPRSQEDSTGTGLREFIVDLRTAASFEEFVWAFNQSLGIPVGGGRWNGRSWNAFEDYLSWPTEDRFKLRFLGFASCPGLDSQDRQLIREVLSDNPHVIVRLD